jgi:electron transport complex protein RnfC
VGKNHLFQADSRYPVREPIKRRLFGKEKAVCRVGVQACLALYRAVRLGNAHTHTVLTVAGDAVKQPQNVMVPFGTSVQEILRRCGVCEDPTYLILGDSMTGVTSLTQDIPVLPGMTCILAFTAAQVKPAVTRACIGCGRCAKVCHAGLLPFEIYRRYEDMHDERFATLNVAACDGCGACSYICPCGLDLTSVVQEAKRSGNTLLLDLEEDTDA